MPSSACPQRLALAMYMATSAGAKVAGAIPWVADSMPQWQGESPMSLAHSGRESHPAAAATVPTVHYFPMPGSKGGCKMVPGSFPPSRGLPRAGQALPPSANLFWETAGRYKQQTKQKSKIKEKAGG